VNGVFQHTAPPSAREAYWSRVLDSKHHTAGNEA
jgi:hypothetical protein